MTLSVHNTNVPLHNRRMELSSSGSTNRHRRLHLRKHLCRQRHGGRNGVDVDAKLGALGRRYG